MYSDTIVNNITKNALAQSTGAVVNTAFGALMIAAGWGKIWSHEIFIAFGENKYRNQNIGDVRLCKY